MRSKSGTAKVFAFAILIFVIVIPLRAQVRSQPDSIYHLPAGTRIRLRMEGQIGSKFSSVDDTFLARIAEAVVIRDVTVLPVGVLVEGRVISASPAGLGSRNGRIDIRMETLVFSSEVKRSINGVPVDPLKAKRPNRFLPIVGGSLIGAAIGLATGSVPGVLVGAGIGGSIGAGTTYGKKGSEVSIKEDDLFEIELKKEVVLPVLDY